MLASDLTAAANVEHGEEIPTVKQVPFESPFWSWQMTALVGATPVVVLLYLLLTCARVTPLSTCTGSGRNDRGERTTASAAGLRGRESRAQAVDSAASGGSDKAGDVASIWEMLRRLVAMGVPTMMANIIAYSNEVINLIFIGHVGSAAEIAAVGLGNTMQNCFGLFVGVGLFAALDTFVSQAVGAGREDLAVVYLQRSRAIVLSCLIWMVPILWFSEDLLLLIGENADIAYNAGLYNKASCFYLPIFFCMYSTIVWLRNLGYAGFSSIVSVVGMILQLPVAGFFIVYLGWGNLGAGCANITTGIVTMLCSGIYLGYVGRQKGFSLWDLYTLPRAAWSGWGEYLQVGVPATLQTICELWYFEVIMLVAGYLGSVRMAAYVSCGNWINMQAMPGLSLGFATSTLVGQTIGSGQPLATRRMVSVALTATAVMATGMGVCLYLCRFLLADLYTSEAQVETLFSDLLLIMVAFVIPDSCQMLLGGALRGLNRSTLVAVTFIVSFWLVALPSALVFAFVFGWGVHGLVLGNLVGSTLSCLVFATAIMVQDFPALALEAEQRMKEGEAKSS